MTTTRLLTERRWTVLVSVALGLFVAASVPPVRRLLSAPLVVSNASASGDAAYVLAGGSAFRERLDAAADLYLMKRVPLIIVMRDSSMSAFSFKAHASWTVTQWALDFLEWRGVPGEKVLVFDSRATTHLGTLDEARSLAMALPTNVARLVLVTSPAHTRRSVLAFTRAFRARVAVVPYAATAVDESTEYYSPLWLEYLKLLAYAIVA
jgi:uncharacterized SAM-binding protein YcdF (DUF218 family)